MNVNRISLCFEWFRCIHFIIVSLSLFFVSFRERWFCECLWVSVWVSECVFVLFRSRDWLMCAVRVVSILRLHWMSTFIPFSSNTDFLFSVQINFVCAHFVKWNYTNPLNWCGMKDKKRKRNHCLFTAFSTLVCFEP